MAIPTRKCTDITADDATRYINVYGRVNGAEVKEDCVRFFFDTNGGPTVSVLFFNRFRDNSLQQYGWVEQIARLIIDGHLTNLSVACIPWLRVQEIETAEGLKWEIFLDEGDGRRFALSKSGSGLKTIIDILTTNRNAAIVIDFDRTAESKRINRTKTRIKTEFAMIDGFCWITKGKEIENYISTEALRQHFGTQLPVLGQYELFPQYY